VSGALVLNPLNPLTGGRFSINFYFFFSRFALDDGLIKMFKKLQKYYHGFYIDEPVGNNAFSFEARKNKRLYVADLVEGGLSDLEPGTEIVFSEIHDGMERNCTGLKHFVRWQFDGKDIFIFDNHQHAFMFWAFGLMTQKFLPGTILVHIDQHKDTRQPSCLLEEGFWNFLPLKDIGDYACRSLNVGNFIPPAVDAGMFADVIMADREQVFNLEIPNGCVADIDMDIFAPDMDYIPFEKKLGFVRQAVEKASFVTIATSPYFMDQDRAISILSEIFNFHTGLE
jgi:hypothetical protein